MPRPLRPRLDGRQKVRLDEFDPADTAGMEKAEALERIEKLGTELSELENLLTYAGTHALLVVLQGRDASGKDGAIRKILEFSNIQQAIVHPFKVPTEVERAHDFLWRVHAAAPRRGIDGAVQPLALRRRAGGARPQHRRRPPSGRAATRTSTRSSGWWSTPT